MGPLVFGVLLQTIVVNLRTLMERFELSVSVYSEEEPDLNNELEITVSIT